MAGEPSWIWVRNSRGRIRGESRVKLDPDSRRAAGNAGAAEGAVGAALQPDVNAVDVEHVVAIGHPPELLAVVELGQTDGALGGSCPGVRGPEQEDGYGSDGGIVEAAAAGAGIRRLCEEGGGGVVASAGEGEAV